MSFVIDCPHCQRAVTVTPELIGRLVACPQCGRAFTCPDQRLGQSAAPPPTHHASPTDLRRFVFTCQRCESSLEAFADQVGKSGRCPTCGAVFTVPARDPTTGRALGPAAVPDDGQLPTPMHAYATAGEKAPRIVREADGNQVILCPRCLRRLPIDADACSVCGVPFTIEGAEAAARPGPESNGYATAALTFGILAVLSFCGPAALLGPAAIGLGVIGLRRADRIGGIRSGRGLAITGIICGAIGLLLFAATVFLR